MIAALSLGLASIFTLLRLGKLALIVDFFRRPIPPAPPSFPVVALIQPITRGAANLENNLIARLTLDYPNRVQHVWVCDSTDADSQAICQRVRAKFPDANTSIVPVTGRDAVASKIEKMLAAMEYAQGEIYCFIDDDIEVLPDTLTVMVRCLLQDGVGAVFALPSGASWDTPWSSLNSLFVNSQAPMTYIPITYFTDPFTITGHLYAVHREHFVQVGGLDGLAGHLHDDYEMALRLRGAGLRCVQTPARYRVHNQFDSARGLTQQFKRWFVFSRQLLPATLSPALAALSAVLSADVFLPTLILLLAVFAPGWTTALALLVVVGVSVFTFWLVSSRYLPLERRLSISGWALLAGVVFLLPLLIVYVLTFADNRVMWRGQRLRVERGGQFEVVNQ